MTTVQLGALYYPVCYRCYRQVDLTAYPLPNFQPNCLPLYLPACLVAICVLA